jgi:hypothetical protein
MTHEDAGHYASKHPSSTVPDERITEAVRSRASEGTIPCAAAHKIAADLDVRPSEVGQAIDLLEIKLTKCQLGLFGYGPLKRIVRPAASVAPPLREAIEASLVDNRLPCRSAWEIAAELGIKKMDVSNACEALKIKINRCQIGTFQ